MTTPNQKRQINCPGNGDVPECSAEDTTLCNEQLYSWKSQGIFTGNCAANGRCEMIAWCPLEDDSNPDIVNGVGAFTAYVKVDIKFCVHILHEFYITASRNRLGYEFTNLVIRNLASLEIITMTSTHHIVSYLIP